MKKLYLLAFTLLGIALASCSSDEPKLEIDNNVVSSYQHGDVCKKFKRTENRTYKRKNINSDWVEATGLLGLEDGMQTLVFKDGEILTSLFYDEEILYPVTTKYDLLKTWQAYQAKMNSDTEIYVATPFELNKDKWELYIDYVPMYVNIMTKNRLGIWTYYADSDDLSKKNYLSKTCYEFEAVPVSEGEFDNIIKLPTRKDAYYYVLNKAFEVFGDKIDLREVYPESQFKNEAEAIIDLNVLKAKIDEQFKNF